ncbi:hypothetical protein PMZ80_004274 [Knufia obscura]|uniref:F-box domain-containing protein n=1 Tax=Knufia obscura TaxID=1635080 RepID=A0ABR0RSA0_9EURO|nr:hypothetical protein PMZ80_004274 [Knufia obscura]
MEQPDLRFYNPFGDDSDPPSPSELDRPNAFPGHRDTLARLHEVSPPESEPDEGNYSPSQSGLSLFRPGLNLLHRDTLARLHFKQNFSKALPEDVLRMIASYLDPQDCKNMRLTCRQWAEHLPQPKLGVAQRLPAEILLDIFAYLPATDYDAARHTCKNWFMVGLDHKVAKPMLRSSGSYPAYHQDLALERAKLLGSSLQAAEVTDHEEQYNNTLIDKEWLMSKRLATESRLSSSWRGSSLRTYGGHSLASFTVIEKVSFERLLRPADGRHAGGACLRHFTVSCCGRYLLVTLAKDIFIYSLSTMKPVARLVASSRVIAMSMDTSSDRYSVAALAEGRSGLSWDLQTPSSATMVPVMEPKLILDETIESLHGVVDVHTESPRSTSPQLPSVLSGFEINTRPTIYRNLGTGSDSPRSVAICPQRKCVAFGCRSGIELHWTTPDSDTSLNR